MKAEGTVALNEEVGGRRPVRERLALIVEAMLARCEREAGGDKEMLYEAAGCAVALQDRQAAQRLFERVWDEKAADIVTTARLALLIGDKEFALKAIDNLLEITEEGEQIRDDEATLIAAAIPEPEIVRQLIPKLEAQGLLSAAAIAAAKIGDRESAVRIMRRAKDRGFVIPVEESAGAFALLAPFDTQLAIEIIGLLESLADRDDLDKDIVDISVYEAGCIAMALGERSEVRRVAESLQKKHNDFLAVALFGMLGELQIVQELMLTMKKKGYERWEDIYWVLPVDISRYNLDVGFEVLRLLQRWGYDMAIPAKFILDQLYWMKKL